MGDSAPDGSKRSVNERIDIRVGVECRRRWGRKDKLRIVRDSLAPNVVVTEVARRQFEQPMVDVRAASHRRAGSRSSDLAVAYHARAEARIGSGV